MEIEEEGKEDMSQMGSACVRFMAWCGDDDEEGNEDMSQMGSACVCASWHGVVVRRRGKRT